MAGDGMAQPAAVEAKAGEEVDLDEASFSSSSSSSESEPEPEYDSDYSSDYDGGAAGYYEGEGSSEAEEDNSPEATIRKFEEALESGAYRKQLEKEEREYVYQEDLFDFPRDPERWREEDLHELWADAPVEMTSPGWDPVWADDDDWEVVRDEVRAGRDPPIAPFYLPYRKHFPAIPDNHYDISNPRSVIEELDRIEEFLNWVSYVFPDGSTYEGTVWDDLAHGKGVFVAEQGLVRYEGEWLQNAMEGHGVVEVEIPDVEPVPGSKLEAKMRAQGRIISRDYMTPEDKNWLEMDIEDSVRLAGNWKEIPFYESDEWIKVFGQKPEKGRYRYAGQWKQGRMHGCGVYEVNERIIYGRFYFGEHVEEDSMGCNADVSGVHAGIAEVAAAKARMFVNKPDGMVREERGPYGDPQHPYLYEEDDVWMAPGFINQFYEVPDYWKTYVEEVDQEREMWLNSFYKAPLRIPMPAELEYWWSKADDTEFVLINKEPEPDPEDPSKLIYTEDPLIVHTPTGRLINFVEDDEHGVRLFWQPRLEGEDIDPEKAEFLPLGFDEFYGRAVPGKKKEGRLIHFITAVENAAKPVLDRLGRWVEERKKASELNLKLIEQELDFIEAELSLKEAMEDMEMELRLKQKEEEKKTAAGKDTDDLSPANGQDDADSDEGEDEEAPTSFGTVLEDESDSNRTSEFKDENKSKKSPFSSLSMSLTTCNLASIIPFQLHESFLSWKKGIRSAELSSSKCSGRFLGHQGKLNTVKFPCKSSRGVNLIAVQECNNLCKRRNGCRQLNSVARILLSHRARKNLRAFRANGRPHCVPHNLSVLSLHVPISDAFAV